MNLIIDRDSLQAMRRLAVIAICGKCGRIFNRTVLSAHRCPFCGDDRLEEQCA